MNRRQSAIEYAAHIYQIYIAAAPEQVWSAITESEWRKRYLHATEFVEPPQPGQPYRTIVANGRPAVDGMIEEMQPPTGRVPGRFVQTWHTLYDPDFGTGTAKPRGMDRRVGGRRAHPSPADPQQP